MAQWQSISLVMRRLWVRFPPPAPKRGRHPMDDDLFLVLRVSPVLLAHGLSLPPREVAQRAGEGEEGFARRGHAKTEIEAFFDLRPPAPPGLLTIQRRYFVRRKTLSRPQAKSLPCARGGVTSSQTGDGRVVICRSLTISQAELPMQVTIPLVVADCVSSAIPHRIAG